VPCQDEARHPKGEPSASVRRGIDTQQASRGVPKDPVSGDPEGLAARPTGGHIMSVPIRSSAIRLPAFAVLGLFASAAAAQEMRPGDCATLEDLKIEDTNLLSSAVVPAKDDLPEYCRVLGYVRPAINFEIRLPTKDWNSKFYMAGCGSRCGKVEADRSGFSNAPNHGLRRNYAVSTMDGGHWGATRSDITWLQSRDPIARFDYDQRAVTATAKVTKEMIKAFYGPIL
jgi:hypothetical protein